MTKSRRNFYLTISRDWCGLLRGSVSPSRETNKYLCTIKNKLQPRRQFCKNCGVALRLNVRQSQTTARDVYRRAAKKQLNFNVSTLGGFRVVFLITKPGTRILVHNLLSTLNLLCQPLCLSVGPVNSKGLTFDSHQRGWNKIGFLLLWCHINSWQITKSRALSDSKYYNPIGQPWYKQCTVRPLIMSSICKIYRNMPGVSLKLTSSCGSDVTTLSLTGDIAHRCRGEYS